MFRSFELFRVMGIPVRVHATLLIFLPLFAYWVSKGQGAGAFMQALLFIGLAFACVLLHELGHCAAALHYRVPVKAITLTPIGGLAGLGGMPRSPWQELMITVAGPAVNGVLAGLALVCLAVAEPQGWLDKFSIQLLWINAVLGLFNLLPGFPMDGGRILRALLAMRLPYLRATQIAVRVGQVSALAMGLAGLWFRQPMLVLVAMFVYLAARAELAMAQFRASPLAQVFDPTRFGFGPPQGFGRGTGQGPGLRPGPEAPGFGPGPGATGGGPPHRGPARSTAPAGPRDFVQHGDEVVPDSRRPQ